MEPNRDILATAVNHTFDDLYQLINTPSTEPMYTQPINTISIPEHQRSTQPTTNQILSGILTELKKMTELFSSELKKTNLQLEDVRQKVIMPPPPSRSIPIELKLSTSSLKLPVKFKTDEHVDTETPSKRSHGVGHHDKKLENYKKAKLTHPKK